MVRNTTPEATRRKILEVAAERIHQVGFQATSVGDILAATGLSKGALYHHFATKTEIGYAVIEEHYADLNRRNWAPVLEADDVFRTLIPFLAGFHQQICDETLCNGCPVNNLGQEMSALDEGFRQRLQQVTTRWRDDLTAGLRRSQQGGSMDPAADAAGVAALVVAAFQGAVALAKNAQDRQVFVESMASLLDYLKRLEVPVSH
ncbi:hypothetical protein ABI59_23300 [Acidobacteria bacterium Mor1]|nr:hypothetical protein ABI59_23300 [Acidobacteria bacterium Mor1]